MSRRGHLAVGLLAAAFIGVVAGACALLVALAVSTLTPVGLAGEIEPDPGVSVDPAVMGIGAVATVAFVFAVMAVCAWWPSQAIDRRRTARRRPVPFVDGMAHAGLPTTMVSGVRMALERGAGRAAVPVGTSIAAIAVATLAIVGSLTFGAGIDHLVETPRLIGLNWDGLLLMPSVGDEDVEPAQIDSALREHPDVAAFTPGTFFAPFPGEEEFNDNLQLGAQRLDVAVLSFGSTVDIGPSVITGRAPMAADEVLIAPETLAELGLALGDTVEGYGQAEPDAAAHRRGRGDPEHGRARASGKGCQPDAGRRHPSQRRHLRRRLLAAVRRRCRSRDRPRRCSRTGRRQAHQPRF